MGSEVRAIELTVVSATDLKKVKKFNHTRCYVVAYIYSAQRQATHVDSIGGLNPTWNAPLLLTCYETDLHPDGSIRNNTNGSYSSSSSSSSSRAINIDIYSHTSGFFGSGDKLVGSVVVPLQHVASVAQVDELSIMAFDVRRPSGKVHGKLNLTLKLGQKQAIAGDQQQPSYAYHRYQVETSSGSPPLITSYSTASGALSTQGVYNPSLNTRDKQEVVTGYPVAGYGISPLGPLPPVKRAQEVRPTRAPPYNGRVVGPSACFRGHGQRIATRADRKARRKKHLATGALIVGGVILGLILL